MTKRIFHSICLAALVVFLASAILIMGVLYEYFSSIGQAQLKMQTSLAAQGVANEGIGYFQHLEVKDCRITWIDGRGNVLYDSESDTANMENHLEREEVQKAIAEGYGESKRYSATLTERSLYSAQKLADGTILRLSLSQNSIFILLLGMAQPVCVIFAIALAISIALAVRVSKKIVMPLNEIDLDHPLSNNAYDELAPFLQRIDRQQKQLQSQKALLLQRETERNTIISCMNEGMILLNQRGKILTMNASAKKLLDTRTDCIGADILFLTQGLGLEEILSKALNGAPGEQIIRIHGETYRVDASPIASQDTARGTALFFFNITEEENAEKMRREFTANVSHELKTPLHCILGYAELLKNDLVKEEDRIPFAGKIYDEALRMVRLVEDIISLSRLDEGAKDMPRETTDLYELAQRAMQGLMPEARDAGVALTLSGSSAVLKGIPQLLYGMIYNLGDNGIKYNHRNGKVSITVRKEHDGILLAVADTGIGIPPEYHERIFERFYRVDKNHSRAVGGTGLGLSIVKHAAKIHNGKIRVESIPEKGTVITVYFS